MGEFGKHIMVEPYMGDMRFDRCILLAKISPDAKLAEFFPKKSEVAKISEPARRRSPIFFRTSGTKLGPKNFDW